MALAILTLLTLAQTNMLVTGINHALLGNCQQIDQLLPHLKRLNQAKVIFEHDFGLPVLPQLPGILTIRGPRQFGKSTWMESELFKSYQTFGPGSTFYINGDYLSSHHELYNELSIFLNIFSNTTSVKRIFIDEITAINNWEIAIKKHADAGHLEDVLIVTTGSSATDLHRGTERLPGRKGKLSRTNYYFTPISYSSFYEKAFPVLKEHTLYAYVISGGSPIACQELITGQFIPPYIFELTRDWIEGEVARASRSRGNLISILKAIYKYGGSPVGQAKLAREAQLANNSVAQGYVEILNELGCVSPCFAINEQNQINFKKPCKYHVTNGLVGSLYQNAPINSPEEFLKLDPKNQEIWFEWVVGQELIRRQNIRGSSIFEPLKYWQSSEHEIDFFDDYSGFIEVKRGQTSPLEFSWFGKIFPKQKLQVISQSPYQTSSITSQSLHDFLLNTSS